LIKGTRNKKLNWLLGRIRSLQKIKHKDKDGQEVGNIKKARGQSPKSSNGCSR
jgi:hypothetical protein